MSDKKKNDKSVKPILGAADSGYSLAAKLLAASENATTQAPKIGMKPVEDTVDPQSWYKHGIGI